MITSSVYVHLQRPDNGEWVTVGRYTLNRAQFGNEVSTGQFVYAPSYIDAGHAWVIDPINLPILDSRVLYPATRYQGMTDVLRDLGPDAWGKLLLQRAHNLSIMSHELDYLINASNADRWGALTVSKTKKPNPSAISSPKISKLADMVEELQLMSEKRSPKHAELRKRLTQTPSLGGARPKATVQDGSEYWLVKPTIATDSTNIAVLEYAIMSCGKRAGLNVADCKMYHDKVRSAVMVKRFDRFGAQRNMVLSGASLLETEYPTGKSEVGQNHPRWSYPLLAQALRRIGAPTSDLNELFGRMIFNAMCGNDDDHPRNHAVIWVESEKKWRFSPAFDIVPNMDMNPSQLSMQLSNGRWDIGAESLMADWKYFGFDSKDHVMSYKDSLIKNIIESSGKLELDGVSEDQAVVLRVRMKEVAGKFKW